MSNLTSCMKKLGDRLSPENKRAVLARARALRGEGKKTADAAIQAVDEQLAAVRAMLPAPASAEQPSQPQITKAEKAPEPEKIDDVGEKIGGARKDIAESTGPRGKRADGEDGRPAWARRFKVSQIVKAAGQINSPRDEGRWVIRDTRSTDWTGQPRQVGRDTFATKEDAEAFVPIAAVALRHRVVMAPTKNGEPDRYEIWRDITDRKRVKVVEQTFDTREAAMAYMVANAQQILEANTTFGEADIPLPPDRKRTGPERRTGNVTGQDFKDTFGLRGVEFGLWNNQDERQALMNDAWDGLMDLADVLGVPPKALGMGGDLALAFGARGHGLQSARAHYERERAVINLTKERGAGSLAHEWFHALDHYFGRQDGKAPSQWEVKADGTRTLKTRGREGDYVSHGFGMKSGVREELRKPYEALIQTMFKKAETYVEDTAKADAFTARTKDELAAALDKLRAELSAQKDPTYWKRNNKPASAEQLAEFDTIAKAMIEGQASAIGTEWRTIGDLNQPASVRARIASHWTNDSLERLSAIYKDVRGRSGFDSTNRDGVFDKLRGYMERYSQRLKMLADAQSGTEKKRLLPTDFAMNAKELDKGRGEDYWTTPHEMAARAFQGYVEDKIAERGGVSRFLNYAPENVGIITPWGVKRPFPAGEERKAINAAFDKFIAAIETKAGDDGGVMMFSQSQDTDEMRAWRALSDNDDLFALPKSRATTIEEIARDIDPSIKVERDEPSDRWVLTLNNGDKAYIMMREPSRFGPHAYNQPRDAEGTLHKPETVRPGEVRWDERWADDVWVNVAGLKHGGEGAKVYAIAGDFAHNTGRVFIGDPAGVSDAAMRRRPEQMLSSALRWGTTEHLAPHPDQVRGKRGIGVSPLDWKWGDDLGNLRRLIDVNLKALENAGYGDDFVSFDARDGTWRDADGAELSRADIDAIMASHPGNRAVAGGRTIARAAVWRALLREASGRPGGANGRSDGLLARVASLAANSPQALGRLFSQGLTEQGSTVESAQAEIAELFGDTSGVVTVVATADGLPPNLRRAFKAATGRAVTIDRSHVYIVADRIEPGTARGTVMHELGVHVGLQEDDVAKFTAQIRRWAQGTGQLADMAKLALRAGEQSASSTKSDESVAYMIQFMVDAGMTPQTAPTPQSKRLLQRFIDAIKAALKALGLTATDITPQDMVDYVYGAAKMALRTQRPASPVSQFANASQFSQAPQTDTPEFKRWFGDSKVVDANGKPLRVFHGSSREFAEFATAPGETQEGAAFFTPDPAIADSFAEASVEGSGEGAEVNYPVYLSIKNPKVLRADDVMERWKDGKRDDANGRLTHSFDKMTKAVSKARAEGHDGLHLLAIPDGDGGISDQWAAFKPEQIKSVFNRNRNPNSPDIRFSQATDAIGRGALRAVDSISSLIDKDHDVVGKTTRTYTPEQIAAMRNVGFQVEPVKPSERLKAIRKDAWKKMAQGVFDQFAPVKDISQHAYMLLRLSKGASGAFETLLNGGMLKLVDGAYDFDETKRGGVIDKLFTPLQGEHHDVLRWIAANRAERLMDRGKENLFTPEDIAAIKTLASGTTDFDYTIQTGSDAGRVTRDRSLIYADANRVFNAFSKNVLDMAEQSGLIDGEARRLWEHEFYVPFYRVTEDGDFSGASIKGGVVRQQAFKALKGGRDKLNTDLLENTLANWAHLLDAAAKNRAAKATLEAAADMGSAIEAPESVGREIANSVGNKNGVVWFMDGGAKRYFFVDDPYLLTAVSALQYAGLGGPAMKALAAAKHMLTVGVTASPFFKVRNLIRDSMQVIATSPIEANPFANVAEGWRLTDPKSDTYFRLLAGGGTIHFGTMLEGSEAKRVQALVESGVDAGTILSTQGAVKRFYRKHIEPAMTAYNELGNRGEAVNRASLYQQLRAQGKSHAEASLAARDLMDFSMNGSWATVRFLTQVVPFFNARIQGLYKLGRAANEDPRRFSAVIGAAALMSVGLLAAYGDDDDWKQREEWDRNNYWWFKFGDTAFRIPKPFEIGAIATLAERSAEYLFSDEMNGKRLRAQVLSILGDNLAMNPIPQAVKPLLDVYANRDSFTGRPIETMGMERLQSEYRATGSTTMLARGASTAANAVTGLIGKEALSPVQIDHLIRGYFGWLGMFAATASDIIAKPLTGQPEAPAPDFWKRASGGMVAGLRDAPSRYVTSVYEQAAEIERAYGTWRQLLKEGKVEEAQEFRQDNQQALLKYRWAEAMKRRLADLNAKSRQIERGDMDAQAKREAIRAINDAKDAMARRLVARAGV